MFRHTVLLFIVLNLFGLVFHSSSVIAQDVGEIEALGFDEGFSFNEAEFEREAARDKESADEALNQPFKPGSVESGIYFAETVESLQEPGKLAPVMRIAFTLTLLSLLPALLLTMTSFTRIIIVFSFVRRAMTLQTLPPNQIVIGLSLILTYFIMSPTIDQLNEKALQPMMNEEISEITALQNASGIMHEFMRRYTRKKDIALFIEIGRIEPPKRAEDVPMKVMVPAFVISELKTAFQMGFVLFLPFLVIDIVVAVVLTAMGMFMLPPPMVSIPFKILLFVLVDGWSLIIKSLAMSFL